MPYERNRDLPDRVRDNIPSKGGKDLFRRVFNSQHQRGKSEAVSFASAWAALANAGYEQNSDGKWVKKGLPSASSVHVPSTGKEKPRRWETNKATFELGDRVEWQSAGGKAQGVITQIVTDGDVPGIDGDVKVTGSEDDPAAQIQILDDEGERTDTTVGHKLSTLSRIEKAKGFTPPKAAQDNAAKVLRWRDEHPDEIDGMTEVGWRRARQLADGEALSLDTVKRISQFARHQGNSGVDPEFEGEPWKDAGHVAWLGWGGDAAILDWAPKVVDQQEKTEKRQINDDVFTVPMEARARAVDLGFSDGAIHTHDLSDGQTAYMPGPTHEAYQRRIAEMGKATPPEPEEPEQEARGLLDVMREFRDLLLGGHRSPRNEAVAKAGHYEVQGKVLKVDDEQRMVYGWASVISENGEPVVDTQGDMIGPDELVKAVNDFMLDDRVGKVMHEGDRTGTIVHSFPVTKDIANALGINTDREGWVVGYHVADDDVWKRVKSGDFTGFSIGGEAQRIPLNEQ